MNLKKRCITSQGESPSSVLTLLKPQLRYAASSLSGYLSEVAVAVDVLLLVTVLQLVVLDVKPESLHDAGSCLRVHAQQTGQPWVQFVLRGLGGEKKTVKSSRRRKGAMKVLPWKNVRTEDANCCT